jgi:peptidoglycan/LPS O-acetylase OafA/YrhL
VADIQSCHTAVGQGCGENSPRRDGRFPRRTTLHRNPYRSDIDGLRAVAILPVLLFHAKLGCPGGFVGVDIFFVISGFLISSLLHRDFQEGTFSLTRFWERRVRRIFPALALMVLVTFCAGWLWFVPAELERLGRAVVAQMALLANVLFYRDGLGDNGYFGPTADAKPLLHTWSLAVEEQFYLIFPLLLLWLHRRNVARIGTTIFALGAASLLASAIGVYRFPQATFFLLPTRAWELLLGAWLAETRGRFTVGPGPREICGWAGIALIGWAVFAYDGTTPFPGLAALPPCLGAAMIIFSSESSPSQIGRLLSLRPLVWVGLISYSLYLWHWPTLVYSRYFGLEVPDATGRALLLVGAGVLAAASWKWVETPFRTKRVFQRRSWIFGLAAGSTAILLLLGAFAYRSHGVPGRLTGRDLSYAVTRSQMPFNQDVSLTDAVAGKFIELGAQAPSQPIRILIWGDSHAMSTAPVIDELCRRFSQRGLLATHLSTPPIAGYVPISEQSLRAETPAYSAAILEFIARQRVENVVLVCHWSRYPMNAELQAKLLATVRAVQGTGAKVLVLKDVPVQRPDLARVTAIAAMHGLDLAPFHVTTGEHEAVSRNLTETFGQISKLGAQVLDPTRFFLDGSGFLRVVKDDHVLYFDSHHLSLEGARLLAPLFEPIIRRE